MNTKQCFKCNESKPLVEFCKDSSRTDGYEYICKSCKSIKTKLYSTNNSEKIQVKWHRYYQKNKERIRDKSRKQYITNIEKEHKRAKIYRKENKEELRDRKQAYKEANRDLVLSNNRVAVRKYRDKHPEVGKHTSEKRRAFKRSVNESYTKEDEQYTLDLFNRSCVNCGATERLSIDHHYPLSKGHALTRSNAVVLCLSCNSSKCSKMPEDFYSHGILLEITSKLTPTPLQG